MFYFNFIPLYHALLLLHTRVGSKLVYHRIPWKEPDAPHIIEVLYEDDDIVSFTLCDYTILCVSQVDFYICVWKD